MPLLWVVPFCFQHGLRKTTLCSSVDLPVLAGLSRFSTLHCSVRIPDACAFVVKRTRVLFRLCWWTFPVVPH